MAYSKTTWNTGDVITAEKLNNAEEGIETAQTTADAAQSAATTAQNTADTAQSTATSAASDATTALSTANSAATDAATAKTTAKSAASDASTALTNVSSAATAAATAQSTAEAAQSTANAVQSSLGNYLPLSGGTMSGDINMGSKVISGLTELKRSASFNDGSGISLYNGRVTLHTVDDTTTTHEVVVESDGRVSGVTDATGDTDAVNLSQLNAVQTALDELTERVTALESNSGE